MKIAEICGFAYDLFRVQFSEIGKYVFFSIAAKAISCGNVLSMRWSYIVRCTNLTRRLYCVEWHNTVFARSGAISVHKLFTSCIGRRTPSVTCLRLSHVSVICRVTYFQFPIMSAFLPNVRHQHCGVLLVLICNIGHRTLPNIWVSTFSMRSVQPRGKTLNWF